MMGMDMTEHIGTYFGHVLPGTFFILWGLWWYRSAKPTPGPCSMTWEPLVIIPLTLLSGLGELWWASWLMTDSSVSNYQHATMYACFAVPAVCFLLSSRGLISAKLPVLTLGGAFAATAGLFIAHGHHMAVSGTIHFLLALLLGSAALVCVCEAVWPVPALAVARCWLTISTGVWFWIAALVLYKSSYDMDSAGVVMRIHLFFIWHLLAVGLVLLLIHLRKVRRTLPVAGDIL